MSVTFGASSDVTVNVPTKLMAQADRIINFNGILRNTGTGQLQVGAAQRLYLEADQTTVTILRILSYLEIMDY